MNPDNPFDRSRNLNDPLQLVAEMRELSEAVSQESTSYRETGRGRGNPDPGFFFARIAKAFDKAATVISLAVASQSDAKPSEPEKPTTPVTPTVDSKKK